VQQRELALARQWRTQRSATPAQKQYAAALLGGGASLGPGGDDDSAPLLSAGGGAELRALFEERQARMQQDIAQHAQHALAVAAGGRAGEPDGERPSPVLRIRVSGVVPQSLHGLRPHAPMGDAVLRMWRTSDEEDGLREGDVLRVTGVRATRTVDLGLGRVLQLDATKLTRCDRLGIRGLSVCVL